jgi:hypothetical protein
LQLIVNKAPFDTLTGRRIKNEQYKISEKPNPSPIATPRMFFKARVKYIDKGKDNERIIAIRANISMSDFIFRAHLPVIRAPKPPKTSQLASIMPIESSLPPKTIRSSRNKSTWATNPLNPIENIVRMTAFFMNLSSVGFFYSNELLPVKFYYA